MQRIELCSTHDDRETSRQEACEQKQRIAEGARETPGCAPGMPDDNHHHAGKNERESQSSRDRNSLCQNRCGNERDKERHRARIERALIPRRGELQTACCHEHIRRALPGDDHRQPAPPEAVASKAAPRQDRRQQQPRDAEAKRCDVPCIQAGGNRQPRKDAPARPDRYCRKAERGARQITRPLQGRRGRQVLKASAMRARRRPHPSRRSRPARRGR